MPTDQDPGGLLLLCVRLAHFPAPTCNQLCQHGPADDRCHQVSGFSRGHRFWPFCIGFRRFGLAWFGLCLGLGLGGGQ